MSRPATTVAALLATTLGLFAAGCEQDTERLGCVLGGRCGMSRPVVAADGAAQPNREDDVDYVCEGGVCTWNGSTCDGQPCPPLTGYTFACNAQDHCEYTPDQGGAASALVWVPPSAFAMGSDAPFSTCDYICEEPRHTVTFAQGYWIDKYEVRADVFAAFLNDRGTVDSCREGRSCVSEGYGEGTVIWPSGVAQVASWCREEGGSPPQTSCASHPAVNVTWYGASSFCTANDLRLCSEAEWERAAKGTDDRAYPWGDVLPDQERAACCAPTCDTTNLRTVPVGQLAAGVSPVGCLDLAGNAAEWVDDCRHSSYASGAPTDGTAWNETCGGAPVTRVVRGGSWRTLCDEPWLRTIARATGLPASGFNNVGFRCCRSVGP